MARTCKDITIRPYGTVRQTRNTPVFMKSPESQKQSARNYAEALARKSKDYQQLGSMGLSRSHSSSQLERSPKGGDDSLGFSDLLLRRESGEKEICSCSSLPVQKKDFTSEADDSESEADSDSSSDAGDFSMAEIDSPLSPETPWGMRRPEQTLKDAIRRRANEQVMFANLKHLTFKGQMRYGDRAGRHDSIGSNLTNAEVVGRRQAVGLKAEKFTELYSDTLGILEAHMTLKPPPRARHSITNADLGAYSTLLEAIQNLGEDFGKGQPARQVVLIPEPQKGLLCRRAGRHPSCPAGLSFEPKDRTAITKNIGDGLPASFNL